ncbi:uncharacterized protein LOC110456890 [Mizuhopecten yessoensis]|uniref:uncharacterized protein LOC110456890 n=1 Tax=Mizuhopecten yessoensis TaxID=6573 RepID=UPI000B4590FA|nr:uncharacterized protein LOC110456890 [Mizuhopecten yessoensis]XP_021363601.1 uncharacterized protein LOC110456890 [Mizuhopecten yessoensis]
MKFSGSQLPSPKRFMERYAKASEEENILLIGAVGAGKSATINTMCASLSGERLYRAPVGSQSGESGKRTTTHLIWYNKCRIDEKRMKEMRVPKYFPNLVDMTGLGNEDSAQQRKLLDMIITGKIWDKTSIPAIQDVQRTQGDRRLERMFPLVYRGRRIHKILFVASATDRIPTALIECVKSVAQPDGSATCLNPRYIPIFGLLSKHDLVSTTEIDLKKKEQEFLECLGINADTSYSLWQNSASGDYSFSNLEFMDKLFSPDIRHVLDEISIVKLWIGDLYEKPSLFLAIIIGIAAVFLGINSFFPMYEMMEGLLWSGRKKLGF